MQRKIIKRVFALVCIVTLLITSSLMWMPEVMADAVNEFVDYRVVTPLTFGIEDTVFNTPSDIATPEALRTQISINKVKFCAEMGFSTQHGSTFNYLHATEGISLRYYINTYKYPVLCNYLNGEKMYAGGRFVDGVYQDGVDIPSYGSSSNRHYVLEGAISDTGYPFHNTTFTLWYTTELVDFDGDGSTDDIKLGVWFNEVLYKDIYFYILNCKEKYTGCIATSGGINSIASPITESEEPSVVGPTLPEITFCDFNIYDDTYGWNNDSIAINGYHPGGFANKTFVGTVNFARQAQTHINFGGTDHGWQGIKLYTKGTETVKLYLRESNSVFGDILIDEDISDHVPLGKDVEIKLSFEVVDIDQDVDGADDVRFWLYLEGELYNNAPIWEQADYASKLGNHLGIYSNSENSSVCVASKELDEAPDEVIYDLTEYAYPLGDGDVWVNGEKTEETELAIPGDYTISVDTADNVIKNLIAYRPGEAHTDDTLDLRDLVATVKAKEGIELESKAAKLGADVDGNGTIEDNDITSEREKLLAGAEDVINAVSFEFLGKYVMPIGGFYGPYPSYTDNGREFPNYISADYFEKIKAAKINLITYSPMDYVNSRNSVIKSLELGERYGIGIFVNDQYITASTGRNHISSTILAQQIKNYSEYQSFCGMYVVDEPNGTSYQPNSANDFISKYGELALNLQYDLGHICYMNMFPAMDLDGDGLFEDNEASAYESYVQEFCKTLRPKVLMWDKYPFSSVNGPSAAGYQSYLYNLGLMRKYAQQYDVPFWAYIQAGGQWNDAKKYFESSSYYPNEGQFDWNVNTSLAFGAQGIQYFPLIQPVHFAYAGSENNKAWDFDRNGLIAADGSTTQWYDYATSINAHIGVIDEVLMNAKHTGILINAANEGVNVSGEIESVLDHMGLVDDALILGKGIDRAWNDASYSEGATLSWDEISNVDGDTMIGCFNYQGKSAYYIVNYNINTMQNIVVEFNKNYSFRKIQNATSTTSQGDSLELTMQPGEGVLVVIE